MRSKITSDMKEKVDRVDSNQQRLDEPLGVIDGLAGRPRRCSRVRWPTSSCRSRRARSRSAAGCPPAGAAPRRVPPPCPRSSSAVAAGDPSRAWSSAESTSRAWPIASEGAQLVNPHPCSSFRASESRAAPGAAPLTPASLIVAPILARTRPTGEHTFSAAHDATDGFIREYEPPLETRPIDSHAQRGSQNVRYGRVTRLSFDHSHAAQIDWRFAGAWCCPKDRQAGVIMRRTACVDDGEPSGLAVGWHRSVVGP